MMQSVFCGRLLMILKSRLCTIVALKKRCFSLADVQSDVLLLFHMQVTTVPLIHSFIDDVL